MMRSCTLPLTEPQAMIVSHGVLILASITENDKITQREVGSEIAACLADGTYSRADIKSLCMLLETLATEWEK